jgi:hypothetical protein
MTRIGLLAIGVTIGVVAGAVGLIVHDITMLALGHYAND